MRTALLMTGLLMATANAWSDEPSTPDAKTEAAAETTAAKPAADAASETKTASIATEDTKRPIKPPAGYRPKRINGEQVWCSKEAHIGSRFAKEDCRTEAELRELIRIRESMRTDMEMRTRTCTSNNGGCGMN